MFWIIVVSNNHRGAHSIHTLWISLYASRHQVKNLHLYPMSYEEQELHWATRESAPTIWYTRPCLKVVLIDRLSWSNEILSSEINNKAYQSKIHNRLCRVRDSLWERGLEALGYYFKGIRSCIQAGANVVQPNPTESGWRGHLHAVMIEWSKLLWVLGILFIKLSAASHGMISNLLGV
jgi:hypothetical protein